MRYCTAFLPHECSMRMPLRPIDCEMSLDPCSGPKEWQVSWWLEAKTSGSVHRSSTSMLSARKLSFSFGEFPAMPEDLDRLIDSEIDTSSRPAFNAEAGLGWLWIAFADRYLTGHPRYSEQWDCFLSGLGSEGLQRATSVASTAAFRSTQYGADHP